MPENQKFEEWALVELFGHNRIAGKVSEATIGGSSFIRIDVPASDDNEAVTKFYGGAAIYCITPTDEETACTMARQLQVEPVNVYSLRAALDKRLAQLPSVIENEHDLDDLTDYDMEDLFG